MGKNNSIAITVSSFQALFKPKLMFFVVEIDKDYIHNLVLVKVHFKKGVYL